MDQIEESVNSRYISDLVKVFVKLSFPIISQYVAN